MRHQRADEVEQEQPPAPTVFGVDPLTLPQVEDNGLPPYPGFWLVTLTQLLLIMAWYGKGFRVPALLGQLRKSLYEKDAFSQEGIFRLAGDELEMSLIKKQLNEGTYNDCIDVNAVATLIKAFDLSPSFPSLLCYTLLCSIRLDNRAPLSSCSLLYALLSYRTEMVWRASCARVCSTSKRGVQPMCG